VRERKKEEKMKEGGCVTIESLFIMHIESKDLRVFFTVCKVVIISIRKANKQELSATSDERLTLKRS
jgi:uncharacterized DUF497 family protein